MSTATQTTEKLLTAIEFGALPDDGKLYELVLGRLVEMNRPKPRHGKCMLRIGHLIASYLDDHDIGHIWGGDSGMLTTQHPDSVRGADAAFTSYTRIPKDEFPEDYSNIAPDLIFEVLSPDDRWPAVRKKIDEYLDFGVLYVCLLEQEFKNLQVHSANRQPYTLRAADEFSLPDILPDFRCRVSQFFE